jgi:DNA topoisomerase-1
LQATGRDSRGRKQYVYHPRWRAVRDEAKFNRLGAFAKALPKLRRRVRQDLKRPGLSRRKILASIVRLLESTFIRIGNEEYTRTNGSFGLTTFRNHHARVNGDTTQFHFRGKSGRIRTVSVTDSRIARIIKKCQDLAGHELFEYVDDHGQIQQVNSEDVNGYIREATGAEFTAKDFRTWGGTLLATELLLRRAAADAAPSKRVVLETIRSVAQRLGNTASVCRKCYIHPRVFERFLDGSLHDVFRHKGRPQSVENGRALRSTESAVLRLLSKRAVRTQRK